MHVILLATGHELNSVYFFIKQKPISLQLYIKKHFNISVLNVRMTAFPLKPMVTKKNVVAQCSCFILLFLYRKQAETFNTSTGDK